MSTFAVEVVTLDGIEPIEGADAIELALIGGYRAIVKKGIFTPGGKAVYIPEDAVVPADILEAIGLTGRLAGKQKNRVKAIRMRGALSQGVVISLSQAASLIDAERAKVFTELFPENITLDGTTPTVVTDNPDHWREGPQVGWVNIAWEEGMDLQFVLNITKWEEPIPAHMSGKYSNRPSWFPKYDIENYKKYNRALEEGEEVYITEKLHGTNAGFAMRAEDRKLLVASRNLILEPEDKTYYQMNVYWQAAIDVAAENRLNYLLDRTGAEYVIVFGEIFGSGVQDLAYGMEAGKREFRVFDIILDGEYVDIDRQRELLTFNRITFTSTDTEGYKIDTEPREVLPPVPVLYRGPFSDAVVQEHTSGNTTIGATKQIREGIVIRPVKERYSGRLGRVILKSVSADYLLRKGGTELH